MLDQYHIAINKPSTEKVTGLSLVLFTVVSCIGVLSILGSGGGNDRSGDEVYPVGGIEVILTGDGRVTTTRGIDCPGDCSENYTFELGSESDEITQVLVANPDIDYKLDAEASSEGLADERIVFEVNSGDAISVTVVFVPLENEEGMPLSLTVSTGGKIVADPGGRVCDGELASASCEHRVADALSSGNGTVQKRRSVDLQAVPYVGYSFVGWQGDCSGSDVLQAFDLGGSIDPMALSCSALF